MSQDDLALKMEKSQGWVRDSENKFSDKPVFRDYSDKPKQTLHYCYGGLKLIRAFC
jgi:hypothetical protein